MSDRTLAGELRVLVLAPTGKDAALTHSILDRAGILSARCEDVARLFAELHAAVGAVVLAEEALAADAIEELARWLESQPPWSDLPLLVVARPGANSATLTRAMERLGNVTVIERPTRVASLVSATRTALRARQRQYQIRAQLEERERALRTQILLASIVESSDDAILSKTLQGIILTWNAGAEHLFGYTAQEVIGRPITVLIPEERQDEEKELLQRLQQGQRIQHYETVRVAKNGRRIDISLTVSPLRTADGTIVGASSVARDITPRKAVEEALRDAARRKDEFLAVLAHELRNPLAPIRNSIEILGLTSRSDPATEQIRQTLERQVNHMVRLVDDLLEVSRITSGKIELRKEPLEIGAVLRSAVEASKPLMEAANHELVVTSAPVPLMVQGDPVRLAQVFANLLNNAAKYTDDGGRIDLTIETEGSWLVVSVRDNGIGIPPEQLPHVFDLFTQIDRHTARAQGGLGIGLTLVKSLVEMHAGSVEAHSEGHGTGSEFVVRLPLAAVQSAVPHTGNAIRPSNGFRPRRVLVVDDNRDAAESLGMLLKLMGGDVRVAYSGAQALETIDTYRPALVFLDIGMPGMSGHEVARQIRQRPELAGVTLVALTGWGQDEDRRQSSNAGFDFHLIKPADMQALEAVFTSLNSTGVIATDRE